MRLIIMWNGRNGSQLLVLSEGGSNIVNLLKIFYFQPPLRIVFFRAKRLLCEKKNIYQLDSYNFFAFWRFTFHDQVSDLTIVVYPT